MNLQPILHKDLEDFLASPLYLNSHYIPISKHRGISHVQNIRALPEDLVLVVIYKEKELVGYLGVLPDDLFFNGHKEHLGWLSCMWIDPKMRGKGLAKKLIKTVFEAWKYRILVTEFTPAAKGLYDKSQQFLDLAKPIGIRGYRRSAFAELLPAKNPQKWARWKGLLKVVDIGVNVFNDLRLRWYKPTPTNFRRIDHIDDEVWSLIQSWRSSAELARRERAAFEWILKYPWLKSGKPDQDSARYHFSSVAKLFEFIPLKIYDEQNAPVGFLLLSVRDGKMKIPYAYFDQKAIQIIIAVIEQQMRKYKIHTLTVFHPILVKYWQNHKGSFFWRRAQQRHYIISKVFADRLKQTEQIDIQDGDADAVFT